MLDSTSLNFTLSGFDVGDDALDLFDVGQDFDAEPFAQEFFGDGAGGDAADGFAGAGAPAALPVADAVLGVVGVVGVRGAELGFHFGVGLGPGVLVFDPQADRRAEGLALERAGEDLHRVGFLARRDDFGLAGPAAVQVGLDVGLGQV